MKKSGDTSLSVASGWYEHAGMRKVRLEKRLALRNDDAHQSLIRTLNRFLSQTSDGVFAIDHQHHIVHWNKTCECIFGVVSHSVIGKPCYEVIGGVDFYGNPVCFSHCMTFTAARQRRIVKNFEMQILRGKEPVWVNVSTIFVQNPHPALSAIIHLVRETCNSRRLEDNLQQMLHRLEKLTMHEKASPAIKNILSLSTREKEVLACLSHGKHAKDIAQQFCVSPSTVRSHIKNILYKLDVHSQMEAVAYAYQHKLL